MVSDKQKSDKQKDEVKTVRNLKPAEYNPRYITDAQKDRLKKALEEFGDLGGIIFNRRTGNLVGGHQRVKVIPKDALIEKTNLNEPSRTGTIAHGFIIIENEKYSYREVDWTIEKEKAANIAANQHGGEWDIEKLDEIIKELAQMPTFDPELIGFSLGDIYNTFGSDILNSQPEKLIALSNQLRSITDMHEEITKKIKDRDDTNFYLVAVFKSYEESKEFLKKLKLPDNRYIDGRLLFNLLKKDWQTL